MNGWVFYWVVLVSDVEMLSLFCCCCFVLVLLVLLVLFWFCWFCWFYSPSFVLLCHSHRLTGEEGDVLSILSEERIQCLWDKVWGRKMVVGILSGLKEGRVLVDAETGEVNRSQIHVRALREAVDLWSLQGEGGRLHKMLHCLMRARIHFQTGDWASLTTTSLHQLKRTHEQYCVSLDSNGNNGNNSSNSSNNNHAPPNTDPTTDPTTDNDDDVHVKASMQPYLLEFATLVEAERVSMLVCLDNHTVLTAMRKAMQSPVGKCRGAVGSLDLVSKEDHLFGLLLLQDAMNEASDKGLVGLEVRRCHGTCALVHELRGAVRKTTWAEARKMVDVAIEMGE